MEETLAEDRVHSIYGACIKVYLSDIKLCYICGAEDHLHMGCAMHQAWKCTLKAKEERRVVHQTTNPCVQQSRSYAEAAGRQTNIHVAANYCTVSGRAVQGLLAQEQEVWRKAVDGRLATIEDNIGSVCVHVECVEQNCKADCANLAGPVEVAAMMMM